MYKTETLLWTFKVG